jgi:hypothetical protein
MWERFGWQRWRDTGLPVVPGEVGLVGVLIAQLRDPDQTETPRLPDVALLSPTPPQPVRAVRDLQGTLTPR